MAKSKSSRPTGKGSNSADSSSFEESLEELEALVEAMEKEQAPLGELIENYEKGTLLYEKCQQHLENAQRRVELIREGAQPDKKRLEPMTNDKQSPERTDDSQANTDADDDELF